MLENEPLRDDMWGAVNGLALMATGKPEYLPRVKALANKIGPKTLKLELKNGMPDNRIYGSNCIAALAIALVPVKLATDR